MLEKVSERQRINNECGGDLCEVQECILRVINFYMWCIQLCGKIWKKDEGHTQAIYLLKWK